MRLPLEESDRHAAMSREPSIIQQLLNEISYDGATVKRYHGGGLGLENVLTAEVLQGLDFLPREQFLGAVVRALNGNIPAARAKLLEQIEQAAFRFLPGPIPFRPGASADHTQTVNPDGLIQTPDVYVFVEAKRIRSSSFQTEQLAREFVVTAREARPRIPLLLLILGQAPPVSVAGLGRLSIETAITSQLEPVLGKVTSPYKLAKLPALMAESIAWITWPTIADILRDQLSQFKSTTRASSTVCAAIERITESVTHAIERHQ
jgi:hypothetical protein